MPQNPLRDFLAANPLQPKQEVDPAKSLRDFLTPPTRTTPEEFRQLPAGEAASLLLKGFGLAVGRQLLRIPSRMGDWLEANPNVWKGSASSPSFIGAQGFLAARDMKRAMDNWSEQTKVAIDRGVVSPEAASTLSAMGMMMAGSGPGGWAPGIAMMHSKDIAREGPDVAGTLVGSLPENAVLFGAAGKGASLIAERLPALGRAATAAGLTPFAKRVGSHLAASSVAAAAQSASLDLQDGESRFMRIVADVGMNLGFEAFGLGALRNSWRNELGEATSKVLVDQVAKVLKTTPELAELKVTQVRGGGGFHDVKAAETVVQAAKVNTKIAGTPLEFQAKKSLSEFWDNVVPSQVVADPRLPNAYGVSAQLMVNGQPAMEVRIQSSKTNPGQFAEQTDQLARKIVELSQEGHSVKIDNITVQKAGAYARFVHRLRGQRAGYGKMDGRELTQFEQALGAAPRGTLAESGHVPPSGSRIEILEPNRPKQIAEVHPDQSDSVPGQIKVTMPVSGETKFVPTTSAKVWTYETRVPHKLTAHSDGRERRLFFTLDAEGVHYEPVDAKRSGNWFRSNFFNIIDREATMNNDPRGFIDQHGRITLSLTRSADDIGMQTQYLGGDPRVDLGPLDSVASRQWRQPAHQSYKTYSERYAHVSNLGSPADEFPRTQKLKPLTQSELAARKKKGIPYGEQRQGVGPIGIDASRNVDRGPIGAGYTPGRDRDFQWEQPVPGVFRKEENPSHPSSYKVPAGVETPEPRPVTAQAKGRGRVSVEAAGYAYEDINRYNSRITRRVSGQKPAETYTIGRSPFITDPEMWDAVRAARILRNQNVDPSTPVRILVTGERHSSKGGGLYDWTISDLADAQPGLVSLENLQNAARRRGFTAIPDGEGVVLKDAVTGGEMKYASRLEAAAFLDKRAASTDVAPNLEHEVEDSMGSWRSTFDPDVDNGDFVPREMQVLAMDALIQGERSGIKVWTATEGHVEGVRQRAERAMKTKDPKEGELFKEVASLEAHGRALRDLEKRTGLAPGTFKSMKLPLEQDGKELRFVYNVPKTKRLLDVYGEDIARLLRVDVSSPESAVVGLARKKGGLEILSAQDVESAIVYSYLKSTGKKPLWQKGTPIDDPVTGRMYRVFPDVTKKMLLKNSQTGGPEIPEQVHLEVNKQLNEDKHIVDTPITPDETAPVSLRDHLDMDEELAAMDFAGHRTDGPPPIMEPKPQPRPPVKHGWGDWITPRHLFFKRIQTETGVPMWDRWQLNLQARQVAQGEFKKLQEAIYPLYQKFSTRADRTDIQLYMEAVKGGDRKTADLMRPKMSAEKRQAAEELSRHWDKWLTDIGQSPDEIKAFFEDIPQLRKHQGDFRAFMGARPQMAKMTSILKQFMDKELNPQLRIDERETDFFTLGTRISRLISYERHLVPVWNEGQKAIKEAVEGFQASGTSFPQDVIGNWISYNHEVLHMPDDLLSASYGTTRNFLAKADKALKKISRGKYSLGTDVTEREALDLIGLTTTLGYGADLVANPSTFVQQFFQITQTIAPLMGGKYTAKGIKYAVQWLKDPDLRLDLERRGIINQPLGTNEEFSQSGGAMAHRAVMQLNRAIELGNKPLQEADNVTRVIAYMGKHQQVMDYGEMYLGKKITWDQFVQLSHLDLQDKMQGPLMQQIKNSLDRGDVRAAADSAAFDFHATVGFLYLRGENPRVLDGTAGRIFGRYGNWPLSFFATWKHVAQSGDKVLTPNKVKAFATVMALNAGLLAAVEEMFDADASRWSVYQSFWYKGGPYLQAAQDAVTAGKWIANGRPKDDRNGAYAADRFVMATAGRLIPGTAALKHFAASGQAFLNGDPAGAARELLGLEPSQSSDQPYASKTRDRRPRKRWGEQ